MKVIPVLDLRQGFAVRAVGGRRHDYAPLQLPHCPTGDPLALADFYWSLGFRELYVADLDAVEGASPNWATIHALHSRAWSLWLDAGIRQSDDVPRLVHAGVAQVISGLETVRGPADLQTMIQTWGERIVVSIDLKNGQPLWDPGSWAIDSPLAMAAWLNQIGSRRWILLDLAQVGGRNGTGTLQLARTLRERYPEVELIAGGGIRGANDLAELESHGIDAALVATALHDGTPLIKFR